MIPKNNTHGNVYTRNKRQKTLYFFILSIAYL